MHEERCKFLSSFKYPVLFSLENDTRRVNIRSKGYLGYAISVGKLRSKGKFWSSDSYILDKDGNIVNGYIKISADVKRYPTNEDLDKLLEEIKLFPRNIRNT
jgi:hypothetical protein